MALLAITALPAPGSAQTGWINEFHYDNDGTDTGEFVEVVIPTVSPYQVDDFSLHLLNGSDGSIYASASGDAFAEGETEGLFTIYTWQPSSLQNGPDGIALAHRGRLLHFISYEGSFIGSESPILDVASSDVGVEELTTTPPNYSLQLRGSGSQPEAFTWSGPDIASPGTVNTNQSLHAVPLQIVPAPASVVPGDTMHLSFILGTTQHPTSDLIGAGFQLRLDTTLFTLIDFTPGDFLTADTLVFRRIKPAEGKVAYGITTTDTASARSGVDTLATVRLSIKPPATADTTLFLSPYDMMATEQSGATLALTPIQQPFTITSTPAINLSTTLVDFGVVDVTSTAADSFAVTNTGDAPLTVTDIASPNPDIATQPSTFTLSAGDSQHVTVLFHPSGPSTLSDTLLISSDDPSNPLVKVKVKGHATAVVWPGDTDNNGLVNAFDVLPIGQHFGRTGPARTNKSLSWVGGSVTPWSPITATYADATGDGLVSQNDIQPIGLNYGRQRAAGKSPVSTPLQVLSIGQLAEGSTFTLTIEVSDDRSIRGMLGIGFGLSYPSDLMEAVQIDYDLGMDKKDLLALEHADNDAGILQAGYTRKRHSGPIVALGTIVSVTFRVTAPVPSGTSITLEQAVTSSTNDLNLTPPVELQSEAAAPGNLPDAFTLYGNYPNPFNSSTTVVVDLPAEASIDLTVYDVLGRTVLHMPRRQLNPGYGRRILLNASRLTSGTYFYRVDAVTPNASYSEMSTFTLLK